MEQRRAIIALEPFILLSKSANSASGAADLILRAISSPNTFVFAELLQTPNIQALRTSQEYSSHLKLLEIFSYGTYGDYQEASSRLPKLSSQQQLKLQQLTLLTLARQQSPLPYGTLQHALSISDSSELESLVGTAHAASLLSGTLDQQAQLLYIDSITPLRDLAPGSLPLLHQDIAAWKSRCSETQNQLEALQSELRQRARTRADRQRALEETFEQKLAGDGPAADDKTGRGKRVLEEKDVTKTEQDGMDIDEQQPSKSRGVKRALVGLARSGDS